uniref:Uncharacterized protein n=1 Tax=Leersia perrieri TaxID=77586 RepID=A0A0D9XSY6_9ORYZ
MSEGREREAASEAELAGDCFGASASAARSAPAQAGSVSLPRPRASVLSWAARRRSPLAEDDEGEEERPGGRRRRRQTRLRLARSGDDSDLLLRRRLRRIHGPRRPAPPRRVKSPESGGERACDSVRGEECWARFWIRGLCMKFWI